VTDADYLSIRRLQDGYADVVSRRAWDELDRLFLHDATVEVDTVTTPARHFTGPAEFAAFVGPATDRFDHFQFVILNSVVEQVDDDEAVGRIFMSEIRHHTSEDEWSTAYGLYQDRYRRADGQWWFADRRYRSLARTGPQAGVFGLPPDLPAIGG
jgi:hypothetical protein